MITLRAVGEATAAERIKTGFVLLKAAAEDTRSRDTTDRTNMVNELLFLV
jgi:hypothetical protein